ncbi:MAG: glycoside hydrolase family 3 C-terminal domain-containing protein [Clostridia bacterium]|nr:glycoside hydrolase family 3 C-terminal domain-containing protein [Clostridia bacterium]
MKLTTKFGEIFLACSASFLAVVLAVSVAGTQNASMVNSFFNTSSYKVVQDDSADGEEEDTNYFPATYTADQTADLKAAYESLAKETEEEGMVLLKNDNNALPLKASSGSTVKVSLFGSGSADFYYYTSGSSTPTNVGTYDTLKEAFEKDGRMSVNPTLWNYYTGSSYTSSYGHSKSTDNINEAPYSDVKAAAESSYSSYNDAAIVVITRESGEGADIVTKDSDGTDGSYLTLSQNERDLISGIRNSFDKIIVVLNSAVGIQLDFMDDVDACIWAGVAGSFGAEALAEVLVGDVNPSGRSVDTMAKDNFSSPAMTQWMTSASGKVTQSYSNYNDYSSDVNSNNCNRYYEVDVEGIYVGYRYYETRYEDYVMGTANVGTYNYSADVAYPFGYGLSYTTFEEKLGEVTYNSDSDTYTVPVTVTNTGDYAGKDVVQVYMQKPYTAYDIAHDVEKASVELVGYAKTDTLADKSATDGSNTQTVEITVAGEQFRSYDSNYAKTYIVDPGTYYLAVGNDAHDAVNNILANKMADSDVDTTNYDSTRMYSVGSDGVCDASLVYKTTVEIESDNNNVVTDSSNNQANLTYSTSSETGVEITNQLDNADPNKYEGINNSSAVTYVSRSNWTGTWPDTAITLSIATETMHQDLLSVTDASQVTIDNDGYSMPKYGQSNGLTLAMLRGLPYDDEDGLWEKLLDETTFAEQALLITDGLHHTNPVNSVVKPETGDNNGPTCASGSVTGYCLPSEGIWAATFNDELIERIGELMGDDSIMAGLQGLYAPGVNIHRTPFCGRAHEYFSEDPYLSGMASVNEIQGIQSKGVVAYVKHVAFNECETYRNGVGVWLNEQTAREIYLLPFEYSMNPSKGNSHAAMTSFNRAGCTWTSGCSNLLLNICRDEFGFDGYFITDMASGNAASYMTFYNGIMAGTCMYDGSGTDSSLDGFKNSARFCTMMREATHRILYVVCNFSAAMNGYSSSTTQIGITPWWQSLLLALEIIGIVLVVGSAACYVVAEVFKHKKSGASEDASSAGDGSGDTPADKTE